MSPVITTATAAPAPGVAAWEVPMQGPARLSGSTRILLAMAAAGLLVTFVAPLWHIALKAPQYPEGLGMYIWSNTITGDLRSINGLNHYIGMKTIHPEAIPELRLMPTVVVGLVALGFVAAGWGRRAGLYLWTGLFAVGALVGLADFWRWGYDYGHNLDPEAAIKIPGMSYQPPLIGPKQLLNFEATSWPAVGGWVAIASLTLALCLCLSAWRRGSRTTR